MKFDKNYQKVIEKKGQKSIVDGCTLNSEDVQGVFRVFRGGSYAGSGGSSEAVQEGRFGGVQEGVRGRFRGWFRRLNRP